MKSTGASSTRPTWKNTGSPIRNPDSSIAQSRRRCPSAATSAARYDNRPAGLGEQLPDDGAEAYDQRHEAERVADALLEGARDVEQRHPRREPDGDRSDQQRDERRQPHDGDEEHHQDDAGGCDQKERGGVHNG